jgi:two-component system, LytTR family, response regulator
MNPISCIAIDDEPLALDVLRRFASKVPGLKLRATFQNPLEALESMQEHPVDLVFLDIQMPDLTGLQLLQALPRQPLVVFTTAYSKYAVDSYEVNAVDYLLKPIIFDRFLKAVNKARDLLRSREAMATQAPGSDPAADKDFIFIKSDTRFFKVNHADIRYIEGMRDYIAVHTPTQKILTLMGMSKMMEKLPQADFMRVHKSYIIALNHITLTQHNRVFIGDKEIPVSNSYKDQFQAFVDRLNL